MFFTIACMVIDALMINLNIYMAKRSKEKKDKLWEFAFQAMTVFWIIMSVKDFIALAKILFGG